jgi:hypothetical protein
MLAYLRYWTNQLVTYITQDVPTYFLAVQRSRLLMIVMPLGRGFSDTNAGEANQLYYSKFVHFLHVLLSCLRHRRSIRSACRARGLKPQT